MHRKSLLALALITCSGGLLSIPAAAVGQDAPAQDAARNWVRYDGHRAVRIFLNRPADAIAAATLTDDILNCEPRPGYLDARVSPEQYEALRQSGLEHEVLIEDLQVLIDAEAQRLGLGPWKGQGAGAPDGPWYEDFRPLEEVHQRIDELVAAHPDLATHSIIGESLEGTELKMVHIAAPGGAGDRPVIFINGTQHAREWVSPMATMYVMEELLAGYGSDPRITAVLDAVEFYFVPMANPDGYQFSWDENRMWRKNRRDNPGSSCMGVDLNRNWDIYWGQSGSSGNPCNDTFRGAGAFSEPEAAALAEAMLAIGPRVRAHMDVHSYGQYVLYPFGWTEELPPDAKMFEEVAGRMVDGFAAPHGKGYRPGPSSTTLYMVSGGAKDWSYDALNAIGMTIELRPIGSPGFILPAEEIIPNSEELFEAILALADDVARPLILTLDADLPRTAQVHEPLDIVARTFDTASTRGADTPTLWWRPSAADPFESISMIDQGDNSYLATIIPTRCGEEIELYFEATAADGSLVRLPETAGDTLAIASISSNVIFVDDFSTDKGWTVGAPDDDAVRGIWNRMMPQQTSSGGRVAQPGFTMTGTACYVTDGRAGSGAGAWDVDEGKTTLFSPIFDLTGSNPTVMYYRWYSNHAGANPHNDIFEIDVSNDGGETWTSLEIVGPDGPEASGGWYHVTHLISSVVRVTDRVQFRFVASDYDPQALVEALIDDFRIVDFTCDSPCYADCDGNGELDFFDFLCFQNHFAAGDPAADCDGSGQLDFFDFLCFQNEFASGCP